MKRIYRNIEDWFIGEYLEETIDVFEKSKIRLIYKFAILSVISIAISLPSVYSMHKVAFVTAV